ncbi:tyrosine-type recombinase/integrase [Quatrionicoccus australiensis]|uniref:tyrosine-type recombinase/integrase n=1 Tax=Quatrionicoccus australiensis TaxID=138118 RepID=UPI001CFAC37D|nr:integrase family protein [Quatrionicoccus australiensis]MCB4360924.1 integrase family protein [Quatrionicoccus australiensis]
MGRIKAKRERLTIPRIEAFKRPADKEQAFLWDTESPRLAVKATASGKAFIFEGKLKGQTIRRVIGDVLNWTIEDARSEARRLQTIIDQGNDPRELDREKAESKTRAKAATEAAEKEAENRKQYTLRALLDAYSNLLESKGKEQSARQTRSIVKCHVLKPHPAIADLPASEITAHHIASLVRSVLEQGKERAAGLLRSYLSAAFNAARKSPFDAKLPASLIPYNVTINPVEPVSTIPVNRGNRTLNTEEMKSYLAGLADDDLSNMALRLALFAGGQRMAQLLRAKINDYEPEAQTLRLWDGKGKRTTPREHLLPLAPKAAAIIEKLIDRAKIQEDANAKKENRAPAYNNLLLFSSYGKTQLVETTPGKRAAEICKLMKCEPFDLLDIRRTCETMMAGLGIHKDTRAQLLSHGLSGVQTAHYDRYEYITEKRKALVAWEKRLDEIATGKKSGNVVQIKQEKAS